MKLNPPFFKFGNGDTGLSMSTRKQLSAFQVWAYNKGCICHFPCNDIGSVLTDAMSTYTGIIGSDVEKGIASINGTSLKNTAGGGGI